jgi:hypothetical protein
MRAFLMEEFKGLPGEAHVRLGRYQLQLVRSGRLMTNPSAEYHPQPGSQIKMSMIFYRGQHELDAHTRSDMEPWSTKMLYKASDLHAW